MGKIVMLVSDERRQQIFGEKYCERLRRSGELSIFSGSFEDSGRVREFVRDSEVIITSWNSPKISGELLSVCPQLKAVLHAAGTVKPIVTDELVASGVRVANSAIAIGEGVAETALALAISSCKGFYKLSKDTSKGLWSENVKNTVKDFYDITVGVISGGYVGRHMVKLLKNFHVDILMYDPILSEAEIAEIGAKKTELDELMSLSDVVTIHAPSIPATDNMINGPRLALLKDGAVLINTARGSIVDETALIAELKRQRIFACIDVTNPEPPAEDSELRSLPNVLLTPHIAGVCTNGLQRIALHDLV